MDREVEVARDLAIRLHRERGIPLDRACVIAARSVAYLHSSGMEGLGQLDPGVLSRAAQYEPIRVVRESVTPWLWVLSVGGFIMAIVNTRRIAKMFSDWRRKKRRR